MQTLDIISVNIWQILVSLLNLVLLFLIVKKFLFKPVQKILAQRRAQIDEEYGKAEEAKLKAQADQEAWHEKMQQSDAEAENILKLASDEAAVRGNRIIGEAQAKADNVMRQAMLEIAAERRKAQDDMKKEIVDVSTALAGKLLDREITAKDHEDMINSFIDELGESNG